jgi:hypothetical protein
MITCSRSRASLVVLALLGPLAAACVEPESAIALHRHGHGTERVYAATFEEAWIATHVALRRDQAGTPEDHRDQGFVITNHPSSQAPSLLSQVGVWVTPRGPNETLVSVVVITGTADVPPVGLDERTLQKDIGKALARVLETSTSPGQPTPPTLTSGECLRAEATCAENGECCSNRCANDVCSRREL